MKADRCATSIEAPLSPTITKERWFGIKNHEHRFGTEDALGK
jgi:hypothetical protein